MQRNSTNSLVINGNWLEINSFGIYIDNRILIYSQILWTQHRPMTNGDIYLDQHGNMAELFKL